MADDDYRWLAAACACGEPVKLWSGRGRKPTRCADCTPKHEPIIRVARPCEHCGVLMPPATQKMQKRFCSSKCVGLSQRKGSEVECPQCLKMFHRRLGGAEMKAGREGPKYCSYACRDEAWRAAARDRQEAARKDALISRLARRLVQLARRKEKEGQASTGVCQTCGESYARERYQRTSCCTSCSQDREKASRRKHAAARRKTAAGRASKSAYKARRRAKERASVKAVDPFAVLERDRWKCRICGKRTPKEKRGSYDDDAPEVDHIVSLAEGGSHAAESLQCACRKCNLAKGSRSFGQLWLGL